MVYFFLLVFFRVHASLHMPVSIPISDAIEVTTLQSRPVNLLWCPISGSVLFARAITRVSSEPFRGLRWSMIVPAPSFVYCDRFLPMNAFVKTAGLPSIGSPNHRFNSRVSGVAIIFPIVQYLAQRSQLRCRQLWDEDSGRYLVHVRPNSSMYLITTLWMSTNCTGYYNTNLKIISIKMHGTFAYFVNFKNYC